jgi:hypothetical protein
MAEENLLETVPKTPFIDPADDTEIPDMTDPQLFTTPLPVDPEESEDDELVKLIEKNIEAKIASEIGSSERSCESV